jgi:putative acetyltransferase
MCDNARECEAAKRQGFNGNGAEPLDGAGVNGDPPGVVIRPARPGDSRAIASVHRSAFDTDAEARLVEALIAEGDGVISLVAVENAVVVGHVLLSTVTIGRAGSAAEALSLAPIAVRPDSQRSGIGSALVQASLDAAREQEWGSVVVLGHPGFYPRFGFEPATPRGILPPWPDVPEDAWMVAELSPGALDGVAGVAAFPRPFEEVV